MARPAWARRAVVFGLVTLTLGGVAFGVLHAFQRQLIYFPDPAPVPPARAVIDGALDVTLGTSDGLSLGAWYLPAPTSALNMAVLVAPGNGGNRLGRTELAVELNRRGFAVLLMDYRGYGGNPGTPSEDGLARDAMAAALKLEELGYPARRTIYLGESLGTGVVAALQASRPPAGVVLRSPFPDLAEVGAHHYPWLPVRTVLRDRFDVVERLARSRVPVTVIYGDRDSVVPAGLSSRVADEVGVLHERLVIAGADHNDAVMFGPRVADAALRLAESIT
jgi:pimeloyl-ACP methyl ester carboxylesterase